METEILGFRISLDFTGRNLGQFSLYFVLMQPPNIGHSYMVWRHELNDFLAACQKKYL